MGEVPTPPQMVPGDPNFLELPTDPDFYKLVRVVKQLDREQRDAEADKGERIIVMPHNTDVYTVAYMSQKRVIQMRAQVPDDPEGNNTGRDASLWVDGFNLGMRFAEAKAAATIEESLDDLLHHPDQVDGNRRQRRSKRNKR